MLLQEHIRVLRAIGVIAGAGIMSAFLIGLEYLHANHSMSVRGVAISCGGAILGAVVIGLSWNLGLRGSAAFALLAMPGLCISLVSGLLLITATTDRQYRSASILLVALAGIVIGSAGVLYGTGNARKRLYLVPVFLAPVLFIGFALVLAACRLQYVIDPFLPAGAVAGFAAVWLSRRIGRHYQRQSQASDASRA